jgi:hypothetical protein
MKHDITEHPYWTRDEFMAFLLFYGAHADMECTEDERQMILSTIPDGHLPEIEKEYHRLTDFERLEVIQSYKPQYYPNAAEKKNVLGRLKEICSADGEFDTMERNLILMLKRIL